MKLNLAYLNLAIDSPIVRPDAQNFRPMTWPPTDDFPVVIDATGCIISRYGDFTWDLRPWAKKPVILNFGDGPQRKGVAKITPDNADLLRKIAAWWLYGPNAVRSPITLRQRFYEIKPLFNLCSQHGIIASDLKKFPAVVDEYRSRFIFTNGGGVLSLLHVLYEHREQLGFTLLDRKELSLLEAVIPDHESRQTPYIPPRIWIYQVNRLRSFLDDFHAHREKIENCYQFCLDAYAKNSDSLAEACRVSRNRRSGPFWVKKGYAGAKKGSGYQGPFIQTARRFGIDELLKRWTVNPDKLSGSTTISIRSLGTYFSMVGYVGFAYILNFSLMRSDEAWSLRADCLDVEHDDNFGPIYILRGRTSKTIDDDDARWPTSPSARVAIEAMTCVTRLRMICAKANPDVPTTADEIKNPFLIVRPYEPWGVCNANDFQQPLSIRAKFDTYLQMFRDAYPCIFELEKLQITENDLQVARLITPSLHDEKFLVGKIWPLAWHQLRRTGSVNMQGSKLVSDASLQYLLKHATRAMSIYYGQGYSKVRLNDEAQALYVCAMYEVLGKELSILLTDRFVSPHGEKRKDEILKMVSLKDSQNLLDLARKGKVAWRETLLGGCTKRGPCPYGGIDNIAHCGGGHGGGQCADALYDREKTTDLHKLGKVIALRLAEAPVGSPYQESLEYQQLALENVLNVIKNC